MDPVAQFLTSRYGEGEPLVEIGVGNRSETAEALRAEGFDVTCTDIEEAEGAVRDDVFDPDTEIYRDAAAMYLVRPGEEMQAAALELAENVGADLAVRPLGTEVISRGDPDLHNLDGTPIYLWKNR